LLNYSFGGVRTRVIGKPFWRISVRLDNTALTDFLGHEPHTTLEEALTATLRGLGIPNLKAGS
jgi:nucleoside-diphosphate-sugar epimerase